MCACICVRVCECVSVCALLAPRAARDVISTKPTCAATCVFGLDFNFWPAIKLKPTCACPPFPLPPFSPFPLPSLQVPRPCLSICCALFGQQFKLLLSFRKCANESNFKLHATSSSALRHTQSIAQSINQSIKLCQTRPVLTSEQERDREKGKRERAGKLFFGASKCLQFILHATNNFKLQAMHAAHATTAAAAAQHQLASLLS